MVTRIALVAIRVRTAMWQMTLGGPRSSVAGCDRVLLRTNPIGALR